MCNLYRHDKSLQTFRDFGNQLGLPLITTPATGNLKPAYVGADQDGPVLRRTSEGLELAMLRWGFPPAKTGTKTPITNIRNLDSRWWKDVNRQWLIEPEYRCLVPFSRFAEWNVRAKADAWFETHSELSFFAGIWRSWHGARLKPVDGQKRRQRVETDIELFAFLTTEPNAVVKPIHPKAMPVILTDAVACETWLGGGVDSLDLQRPLADDELVLVEG